MIGDMRNRNMRIACEAKRGGGEERRGGVETHRLHSRPIDARGLQVDEHQVVVGPAGDEGVAALLHRSGEPSAVLHHL